MNDNLDIVSESTANSLTEAQRGSAVYITGLFCLLLMAGCVAVERKSPQTGAPQGEVVADEPPIVNPKDQGVAKAPAKIPAEQPRKKEATPSLDLTSLEKRLRETSAIGVFTKVALKNQVDDLLDQFRAHYQGRTKTTLPELRQPYDMLLLKVLSLLQDGDPPLARMVVASREAIWSILADPVKFATI